MVNVDSLIMLLLTDAVIPTTLHCPNLHIFWFLCSKENNLNKPNNEWKPSQRPGKIRFLIYSLVLLCDFL